MRRCLIIGNQTLTGGDLQTAVKDRIDRGVDAFYVVAPTTRLEQEAAGWVGALPDHDAPSPPGEFGAMIDEQRSLRDAARDRAGRRSPSLLDQIRSAGGQAEGEFGDTPVTTITAKE